MQHSLAPGLLIKDRYKLIQSIGQGSFGEVWLSDDIVEKKFVALKIYQWLDRDGMKTFTKEMETTKDLIHPNLLLPNEFNEWNQRPFLVMEYCGKGSVSRLAGTLTEEMAWKFIRDVAAGLAYLHGLYEPIVHQDVKPYNIVISDDNTYKITDFGISTKVRDHLARNSGHRNPNAGALAYMAPERFTPDSSPLTSSDIWAFGVTIYELLSGRLPFNGMGGGMLKGGAEIPNIPSHYSERLDRLVTACMQKETWDRPTASDLQYYAEAVLRGESPVGPWENAPVAQPNNTMPPEFEEGLKQIEEIKESGRSRAGRWKIAAAALAGILLVGGLIYAGNRYAGDDGNSTAQAADSLSLKSENIAVLDKNITDGDEMTDEMVTDAKETSLQGDPDVQSFQPEATKKTEQPSRQPEASQQPVAGDGYVGPEDTGRPQNMVDRRHFSGKDPNGYVSRDASTNQVDSKYKNDSRVKNRREADAMLDKAGSKKSNGYANSQSGKNATGATAQADNNNLRTAVYNNDYATVKKYAESGNVNAYLPMADMCMQRHEYANAEKYAKKAQAAGISSAGRVIKLLDEMGYYD